MGKYIVLLIILVITIFLVVYLFRKKHRNELIALEKIKLQVQHEPIFEELTKVKQLNMTGETEEKFERWRSEWTEVVDVLMPKIDSLLFDAEEVIERIRYRKIVDIENEINEILTFAEETKNNILEELEELIGSEEKNRIEMEQLKAKFRLGKQQLLAKPYQFGEALQPLEYRTQELAPAFEEFDELTKDGNYLTAREKVLLVTAEANELFEQIEVIPALLEDIQKNIPKEIKEIRYGAKDLELDGYSFEHLSILSKLTQIEEKLAFHEEQIALLQVEGIADEIKVFESTIEEIYDALEAEVKAKQKVLEIMQPIQSKVDDVIKETKRAIEEVEFIQNSYQLSSEEAQKVHSHYTHLLDLKGQLETCVEKSEGEFVAYSSLQSELEQIDAEIDQHELAVVAFIKQINNLREEEIQIRVALERISKRLQYAERQLRRSNLPGIPEDLVARIEEVDEHIYVAEQSLTGAPINIPSSEKLTEIASHSLEEIEERISTTIENVKLIEAIIQYGNRYRLQNEELHTRLLEAEESFSQFRYAKALEEAGTAVEEAEPGAIKKIEMMLQTTSN